MRHYIDLVETLSDGYLSQDGEPIVFYHGTMAEFSEFRTNTKGLLFFSPKESATKYFSDFGKARTISVYLKCRNVFEFSNEDHVSRLLGEVDLELAAQQYNVEHPPKFGGSGFPADAIPAHIRRGRWIVIETPEIIRGIKALGHDGIYLLEGGDPTIAIFDPSLVEVIDDRSGR